jgi:hypothetical protein
MAAMRDGGLRGRTQRFGPCMLAWLVWQFVAPSAGAQQAHPVAVVQTDAAPSVVESHPVSTHRERPRAEAVSSAAQTRTSISASLARASTDSVDAPAAQGARRTGLIVLGVAIVSVIAFRLFWSLDRHS